MVRADDVLEQLLPGAPAPALRRARDVARFLRLLLDDARRSRAPAVGIDLASARATLEHADRRALERALEDLLRHHLRAIAGAEAFLDPGTPALTLHAAWRVLEDAREDHPELPELCEPGESAAEGGARILSALEQLAGSGRADLWRARLEHAASGPAAGAVLYRQMLAPGRRERPSIAHVRGAIAGVAECLLERGAVREARDWLGAHPLHLSMDPRLRLLLAWTRLALEDVAGARAAISGLALGSASLPAQLAELRVAAPDWLPVLAGQTGRCTGPTRALALEERGEVGASALAVIAFRPGHATRILSFDAAPSLQRRREAWAREREGASAVAGERERELVARAEVHVEHAAPGEELRGTLGIGATRALALAPVLDGEGEVAGWLHLEFEHHLVPARAQLAACAAAWRDRVVAQDAHAPEAVAPAPAAARRRSTPALAAVFRDLVQDLGIKTAQRRWWGFTVVGDEAVLSSEGGEGQGYEGDRPGRRRGVSRALVTGGRITFETPDPHLSVDVQSASGVVLAIRFEGRTHGLLAIESSRRRDFASLEAESTARAADCAGAALRAAQFQAWHGEQYGFEPWLDVHGADFQAFARRLAHAARARSAVVLEGPSGAGKRVFARWLHFDSAGCAGPLHAIACAAPARRDELGEAWAAAARGTLLLEDVEGLGAHSQEELFGFLALPDSPARRSGPRRLVVTARSGWRERVAAGGLRQDLALRLDRLCLFVPGLAARRAEVPPLAQALAERFADEEGCAPPRLLDDALACLWRQPWPGNVRELENLVYKLVLASRGRDVDALVLARVAEEYRVQLVRRLPSRHPDRRDLVAALRTTQTAGGRVNKTRAALYLGWDPDTLAARLGDAGIGDVVPDVPVWSGAARSARATGGGDPDPSAPDPSDADRNEAGTGGADSGAGSPDRAAGRAGS